MRDERLVTRLEDLVGKTIERVAIAENRFASKTIVLRFTDTTVAVFDGGGWVEIGFELDDQQRYAIGLMTDEEAAAAAEQRAADEREFERLRRKLGR